MRADNSHHLVAAARRRSDTTRDKATRALDRLVRDRQQVTFDTVARAAAVSRAWLYADPELRARIGQTACDQPPSTTITARGRGAGQRRQPAPPARTRPAKPAPAAGRQRPAPP